MITAYKGRTLDPSRPVFAYRNLHRESWSLRQRGLVVGHADEVALGLVSFRINEKGRQRAIREKRKNVHAGAVGFVIDRELKATERLSYSPYQGPFFVSTVTGLPVEGALGVRLAADGKAYV